MAYLVASVRPAWCRMQLGAGMNEQRHCTFRHARREFLLPTATGVYANSLREGFGRGNAGGLVLRCGSMLLPHVHL